MHFDSAQRKFSVSVGELAEEPMFHRIGSHWADGWNRMGFGAQMHARILAQRRAAHPAYRSEVAVEMEIPVDDWVATVTGRLDGCHPIGTGGWTIEEFKLGCGTSVKREGLGQDRHRRQLLWYCHLWFLLHAQPTSGSLIYVDAVSDAESPLAVSYDSAVQSRECNRRLRQLLSIWLAEEKTRARKAHVAGTLPFPHSAVRPGQVGLIAAVRQAIRFGQHLMAEAPTGLGKTAGVLHPALSEAMASGKQVVFLTPKTLQQRMAVSTTIAMNVEGAFKSQQIRAKEKMCANGEVICHEDFCPYAREYPQKMTRSHLLDRLRASYAHYDPDLIFTAAKAEEVCPFQVQLELARGTDVLIADYNYVFDPGVALQHLSEEGLGNAIVVVDEAHNLADRARATFSPELDSTTVRQIQDYLLFQEGPLFEALRICVAAVAAMLNGFATDLTNHSSAEMDPPRAVLEEVWKSWEPLFQRYLIWKQEEKKRFVEDPVLKFHFALHRIITILPFYGPEFSCVVERLERRVIRFALLCLDPAKLLRRIFQATASTILLSATLSPVAFARSTLGLEPDRTQTLSLPPPFPRENRKVMIVPQVRTAYSSREENYRRIAVLVAEMSDAQSGNVLVLFPSYHFLGRVRSELPPMQSEVIAQKPGASDQDKEKILSRLENGRQRGVMLFAVMGGMYAEGVDYPDGLLSGVFVISPGLPQVSFERELLRRYYEEKEGAGFEHAYLLPGMTRVIQAAGRLIRSEHDRGVIVLLCNRFVQEPYRRFLPEDWFDQSPLELAQKEPVDEIRKFFSGSAFAGAAASPPQQRHTLF